MMKKLIMLALMTLASSLAVANENYSRVFKTKGSFDDVRDAVQFAIEGNGLKINSVNHIAEMLARTGRDLGKTRQIFVEGEQFEFCSADLSRRMMEADPGALIMCPYIISVYTLPDDPAVYVAYRKPISSQNPALRKVLNDFDKLLAGIIQEAIR